MQLTKVIKKHSYFTSKFLIQFIKLCLKKLLSTIVISKLKIELCAEQLTLPIADTEIMYPHLHQIEIKK